VTYRPDLGFSGEDAFKYWVTDGFGNFTPAKASVEVAAARDDAAMSESDNPHPLDSAKHGEHAAVFDLVRHADATHVAVRDGSWFDPAIWADGVVPGDDARVVIAEGVEVAYDGVSDARLFTVRVDGRLDFATDADTRMVVDTMVVDSRGTLTAGTEDAPVQAGVSADIVIANNGAIDTDWDPQLLSRGVISHGTVAMHGQEKATDLKVASDPMAGDTSLTLAEAPVGWQVGDTIVLAGTRYDGYKWDNDIRDKRHYEPEDEVRTITAIDGDTVHFDAPLAHDHDTPRADLKASVANYSRNITVATEDPDTAAVHERGHVMFMHSDDVDVRYAAFHELGRTDKSVDAVPAGSVDAIAPDTNVQGRYAFHFHRTGLEDQENPAMAVGNAVFGSPGWGFVHHDSHAVLHDNATYDTFGAGFVAETGNETGSWSDNIAIYAKGVSWAAPKNGNDAKDPAFDLGRTGDGFWFQGRMVESADNIAASVNHGFVYMHRGKGMLSFDAEVFDFPEALGSREQVSPDDAPILSFRDNEAFAAKEGLHVVKANPNQGHDIHSHLQDFTAWSVRSGAHIEYTSHYILEGFDVVGKDPVRFSNPGSGISLGKNTTDVTIIDAKVDGFSEGITASKGFTFDFDPAEAGYAVINAEISDTTTPFEGFASGEIPGGDTLVPGRFEIRLDAPPTYKEGYPDPDARKVHISGVKIDSLGKIPIPAGSDSYDAGREEVINILETDGFYETADGIRYFVLEDYYTDRGTGEIHKFGHLVEIDANVPLQNPYHAYKNAVFAGAIDLDGAAPVTAGEHAHTAPGADVIIDLLANDHDPDGDAIAVDGIVQPENGRVFDNGDGTVTYRPDLGFSGEDAFKYWVTDGFGNFTPAKASVEVAAAPAPAGRTVIETGTLILDHTARTVTLETQFDDPVVMATVATRNGGHEVTARVVEAEGNSLTLQLDEPNYLDGWHKFETVNYTVVEAGEWELADGTRIAAGTEQVSETGKGGFTEALPASAAGSSVFLAHLQEAADPDFMIARTRMDANGTSVTVQKEEGNGTPLATPAEVGWLSITPGSGTIDEFQFAAGRHDGITHRAEDVSLDTSFAGDAHVIAAMSSFNGPDTAWLRLREQAPDRFTAAIEEERSRDHEIRHTGETLDYFAFSQSGAEIEGWLV